MELKKDKFKALKSRKLWLAVISSAVAFGNAMWNWGLSTEETLSIVLPLLTFVGVEGYIDANRA